MSKVYETKSEIVGCVYMEDLEPKAKVEDHITLCADCKTPIEKCWLNDVKRGKMRGDHCVIIKYKREKVRGKK